MKKLLNTIKNLVKGKRSYSNVRILKSTTDHQIEAANRYFTDIDQVEETRTHKLL